LVNSWWLNHQASLSNRQFTGAVDWKQWSGGTSVKEPDALRFFNWYYFYEYSGGLLVGQAAHIVDSIQWFMNSTKPVAVTCTGGKINLTGAEIPETATIAIQYPENYLAVFTLGYKAMQYAFSNDQMQQFHGASARFDVGREGYSLWPADKAVDMKPEVEVKRLGSFLAATRDHIRNFLDCIRTRKDPNATVEHGRSTRIVLSLAMDSLRSGTRQQWKG
jgi:predicted dehydrogenase